jgi:hypothetical protein
MRVPTSVPLLTFSLYESFVNGISSVFRGFYRFLSDFGHKRGILVDFWRIIERPGGRRGIG